MPNELFRKALHVSSMWIPLLYSVAGYEITTRILLPITALVITLDSARTRLPMLQKFLEKWSNQLLRSHEFQSALSGASYFMIGASAAILLFPKNVAITALWILILADTAACFVGKKYGKHRLLKSNKTVEGSLAFFFTSWSVVIVMGLSVNDLHSFYLGGAFVACIATLAELFSARLRVDDNIAIPVLSSMALLHLHSLAL